MTEAAVSLTIPIADAAILALRSGDPVLLSGVIVTARDRAHQWLYERFIHQSIAPTPQDLQVYNALKPSLNNGLIYHCGPIVEQLEDGSYRFIAAGPTTSIREEPYQAEIMRHFNLKGIVGKGGMGIATLQACAETPAVYFHAVGGTAALIAQAVVEVLDVHKLEFGMPEAMWVIRVKDFPVVVTMDAHNHSLHKQVLTRSKENLENLLGY